MATGIVDGKTDDTEVVPPGNVPRTEGSGSVQTGFVGYAEYRFENACAAYRRGEVTLSRAAELADLSLYDLLIRLPEAGLQLNLTADELRRELVA